jgi:MFS family permease
MAGVITTVVVRPEKYGTYMAIISSVFAVASVLGPVLGGAINDHSSWRWVFLLKLAFAIPCCHLSLSCYVLTTNSAPAGATATILIVLLLPSNVTTISASLLSRLRSRFTLASCRRLDLTGVVLMLVASILLVFALEEAGTRYAWSSGTIICTLVIAVSSWVAFVAWEIWLEKKRKAAEPIFPMQLLRNRVLVGMLL